MSNSFFVTVKGKGKIHPRTGHEGPEGKQRYRATLSLASALDGDGWSMPRPGRFNPGKDVAVGSWVVPRAGLDGHGKPRSHQDSIPDPPARSESLHRLRYTGPLCNCTYSKALGVCVLHIADCTTQITLKTKHIFIRTGSGISQRGVFRLRSLNMRRRAFWQIDTKMHGVKPAKIVVLFSFTALGCMFNRTQKCLEQTWQIETVSTEVLYFGTF